MADIIDRLLAGTATAKDMEDAADEIRALRAHVTIVGNLDAEFNAALRDLVAAHVAYSDLALVDLKTPVHSDKEAKARAMAQDQSYLHIAVAGTRVAILAMQRGIKPSEDSK